MTWRELHDLAKFGKFPARFDAEMKASYNVAPTHSMPIVHDEAGARVLAVSRWGFVPVWWKEAEPPRHTINARSETAATSGLFRGAFKAGRCIVPASGFFEWQAQADGSKTPMYITRADGAPLLFGGLHDCRDGADTFAILTTGAPHGFAAVHDRSPVILEPERVGEWLDASTPIAGIQALCAAAGDGVLQWHRVGKAVGNVRNNSADLIEAI